MWHHILAPSYTSLSSDPGYELIVEINGDDLEISCNACAEGFAKSTAGSMACTACKDGLVSSKNFTSCELETGYWRTNDGEEAAVLACLRSDSCIGGESVCQEGFTGHLCAVCAEDHYPSGYFECHSCTDGNSIHAILTIIIFVSLLGTFVYLMLKASDSVLEVMDGAEMDEVALKSARERALRRAKYTNSTSRLVQYLQRRADTLVVRFKILVTHYQIMASFPTVLNVQWPEAFGRYTDAFSVFNLDFWGILSKGCFFRPDFLKKLVFMTLLPLGIVAVIFCYFYQSYRKGTCSAAGKWKAWNSSVSGALLTAFFFYIISSTLTLEAFDCEEFDDGSSYLRADYSISCNSHRYKVLRVYAGFSVIFYPMGIPLLLLAMLVTERQNLNPDPKNPMRSMVLRDVDPKVRKTRFLWATYRPRVYWYEVWETLRKLLLTGLLIYFKNGTSTQVVVAMMITLTSLRVLYAWRPYKRRDENTLAEVALWVTFLTLLVGLLIKSGVTSEDGYDDKGLGVILSLMNVSLLLLAIIQLLWATSVWFHGKVSFVREYFDAIRKTKFPSSHDKEEGVPQSRSLVAPVRTLSTRSSQSIPINQINSEMEQRNSFRIPERLGSTWRARPSSSRRTGSDDFLLRSLSKGGSGVNELQTPMKSSLHVKESYAPEKKKVDPQYPHSALRGQAK